MNFVNFTGIRCDHCDYRNDSVEFVEYPQYITKPCPECGNELLTQQDYDECLRMIEVGKRLNEKYDKPDLNVGEMADDVDFQELIKYMSESPSDLLLQTTDKSTKIEINKR